MDTQESDNPDDNSFISQLDDELVKCVLTSTTIEDREYICTFKKLGKGAYSKVYKGYIKDKSGTSESVPEDKLVAIKKMNLEQLRAHDFLENEIDIMKRLNHPNILNMIDVIEQKNSSGEKVLYIILEFCGGGDLKKMVRHRRMKEKYAIVYFKQIADGLQYLRDKNIIHRDLKPHNVLITSDRKTLKIADFGFAKMIGSDTLAETMCGSPLYMAPEILLKKPYTSKADLWSVGVMLYEVLCAKHPFKSVESIVDLVHKVEKDEIQFPSSANISQLGIDLLKRLLKKDPHQRIGWTEFFNHRWFRMLKDEEKSESQSRPSSNAQSPVTVLSPSQSFSESKSSIFSSLRMSHSRTPIQSPTLATTSSMTSPLPIIDNYAPSTSQSQRDPRAFALSPPSFINSPMFPNDSSISSVRLKIIDNYESEKSMSSDHPSKMQSMPILPFEASDDSRDSQSQSQSKKKNGGGFSDYLGTSFKMLRDSFHSQSLH
jgi:serine/threonine protein kinase